MIKKIRGHSIHYLDTGAGLPVILVHGIAASLHDWEQVTPPLVEAGCRVIAVDLLGHGESAKPEQALDYQSKFYYALFEEWVACLQLEQPAILIGHSLGGYLCLQYALAHPERLRGMVLVSPLYDPHQLNRLGRWVQRRPGLGVRALQALPAWLARSALDLDFFTPLPLTVQVRRQNALDLMRASPQIAHLPASCLDLSPRLDHVQAPTLLVWGDRDFTLNPASFPRLAGLLPHADACRVPGCGHQPHLSQPEHFSRRVLEFIHSLPAPG